MAKFESKGDDLFINGQKVLKAWESFNGWYWFATHKEDEGETEFSKNDVIWYGFVQGFEEEWGSFSQGEIESLAPKTWRIPKKNLAWSGRR